MKTFFKTIDEIRNYITIDISSRFSTINPYLVEAHKFIRDILGPTTFNALLDYYDTDGTGNVPFDNLLPYVQASLANFGYMLGAKKLMTSIGETGIQRAETSAFTPASLEEVKEVKKAMASSGYNFLEELIIFIDENQSDYPDAYAYLFAKRFIINSATELNDTIFTDITNRDFIDMKKIVNRIEQNEIKEVMGADLFNTIKSEIRSGTISPETQALLDDYFTAAVANLAYYEYTERKHIEYFNSGEKLLEQYRNDVAELAEQDVERFENIEENPFFVAGSYNL